jgi:hypothetical protein
MEDGEMITMFPPLLFGAMLSAHKKILDRLRKGMTKYGLFITNKQKDKIGQQHHNAKVTPHK